MFCRSRALFMIEQRDLLAMAMIVTVLIDVKVYQSL